MRLSERNGLNDIWTRMSQGVRAALVWAIVVAGSVAIGFLVTMGQSMNIDDHHNLRHGAWLLYRYGLGPEASITGLANAEWYGPLFDAVAVGAHRTLFAPLQNEFWVLRALTFTLLPLTLVALYGLLVRAKVEYSTALVAVALLLGMVRLGGHAIVNQKDFPFACVFLIATLYAWVALREIFDRRDATVWQLIGLGVVATLPFLIRPVPPLHLAIVSVMLYFFVTMGPAKCGWKRCVFIPVLPAGTGAVLILLLYPTLWDTHPAEWIRSFDIFSTYPWSGRVRAFGMDFEVPTDALPRWYVFAWLPVLMNPFAFFFLIIGFAEVLRAKLAGPGIEIKLFKWKWSISLAQWLCGFVVFTWLTVVVLQPTLYDEERHLLFLYPLVAVFAALGFRSFVARYRLVVSASILLTAALSYADWKYYAYVYKNPMATPTDSGYFMGDYWGTCADNAIRAMYEHVPPGTRVRLQWVDRTAGPFLRIINDGFDPMFPGSDGPPYWISKAVKGQPHAFVGINRLGEYRDLLARVYANEGPTQWELVWQEKMPPDDIACILIYTKSYQGQDAKPVMHHAV